MKHLITLAALFLTTSCFGQEACPNVHDINSNGTIDIEDFLSILGLFADVDVDEDGVWDSQDDCLDATACNYLASPTEPCSYLDALGECGGACEGDGDGDGICDDVDTCVGELDECGICNGPGPTEVVIEDITILYDSLYAEQIDEWWVFEVGIDTTFSYVCVGSCGNPISYQGYNYETVQIGEQCWFAEDLRSESYENGDAIPAGLSDSQWQNTSSGAVAVYGEGSSNCTHLSPDGDACDEAWALIEYGRLYNWWAVDDDRGLCPSGWHIPSDGEWMTMEMALGMSASEANEEGWRGTDQGVQMKAAFGWFGSNGTNSSGFSALPGGARYADGRFEFAGNFAYWWSSTPISVQAGWGRYLYDVYEGVYRSDFDESNFGVSVRCVKDSE